MAKTAIEACDAAAFGGSAMPFAANPGSPALRTSTPLLLLSIATSALFTACSATVAEDPGWRQVSPAPTSSSGTTQSPTTASLGDPFVLIADATEPVRRLTDAHMDPNAEVQSAWAMLTSDACTVELSSLNVAFRRTEDGPTGWLTTAESTPGIVLDASSHHAIIRYETTVRVDREPGWSTGQETPATVDVEVRQDGEQLRMLTSLVSESPNSEDTLRLEFIVVGKFDQNPDVIPERRFACPH